MVAKPPLPETVTLPETVNGWHHAPESDRNGHVWTAPAAEKSVGVFSGLGDCVRVSVFDDRVTGLGGKVEPVNREFEPDESQAEATEWGVERALAWMDRHAPDDWSHPDVEAAAFDPPAGYTVDRYYLTPREHVVYYRREDADKRVGMGGERAPESDPTPSTRAYLVVKSWRGSGNSTVALAPWLRASDGEMETVVEPPEECGLPVALKLAREYVTDHTDHTRDTPAAGQSGISQWATQ